MDRRGWVTQVAQVEAIAGELDGHIKALSSLVTRLMVRRRAMFFHLKGYDFRLMLDYIRHQLESALRSQIALEVCSPMLFLCAQLLTHRLIWSRSKHGTQAGLPLASSYAYY